MSHELPASTIADYSPLLGELVELGDVLCSAITAGDGLLAMAASHQARRVRSLLAEVDARPTGAPGDADTIAELAVLTSRARGAELAIDRWLRRPLPGDAAMLQHATGVLAITDAMLPAVWDFDTDLVVLIGSGLAEVGQVVGDLGQRRLIMWDTEPCPGVAIRAESIEEIVAAVRTMDPFPPNRLVVRGAAGTDPERVEQVTEAVRDTMSDLRIHCNTVRAFSRTWLAQGAANLPAIAAWPSISAIGDRFRGKPMIIVAPGPSLAGNVAQLHAVKGRAIICAFSHSLKPLVAAGITPDLVVTVDPQDVRYHFTGTDLAGVGALINGATVQPALYDLGAPRYLSLSANSAIDDWIYRGVGDDALAAGGGSVATTAFSLALRWGCDPIAFIGLDLSFSGGNYYVATSCDGDARAVVDANGAVRVEGWSPGFRAMKAAGGPSAARERSVELPGWHGGTVPSGFMFSMFHRWFVERTRTAGVGVFNCTEGGAFIEGMTHVPFADLIATLTAPVDTRALLDDAIGAVDLDARRARMRFHVAGFVRGVGRARRLAERCRHLAGLVAAGDPAAEPRLTSCERALARAMMPLGFVSMMAQREIERAQRAALRPATETDHLAESSRLFAAAVASIDEVRPILHRALAALRLADGALSGSVG